MQQNLNLVFNKHYLRIFRIAENSIHILHEEPIDSKASFFRENLKEVIRKNHQNPEKINLWYSPVKYTLLPSTIFLPSKLENYFELNFTFVVWVTQLTEVFRYTADLKVGEIDNVSSYSVFINGNYVGDDLTTIQITDGYTFLITVTKIDPTKSATIYTTAYLV